MVHARQTLCPVTLHIALSGQVRPHGSPPGASGMGALDRCVCVRRKSPGLQGRGAEIQGREGGDEAEG